MLAFCDSVLCLFLVSYICEFMPCCCVHYLTDFVFLWYTKIFGSRFTGFSAHMWRGGLNIGPIWRGGLNFGPIWLINLSSLSLETCFTVCSSTPISANLFSTLKFLYRYASISIFVKTGIYFFPLLLWIT